MIKPTSTAVWWWLNLLFAHIPGILYPAPAQLFTPPRTIYSAAQRNRWKSPQPDIKRCFIYEGPPAPIWFGLQLKDILVGVCMWGGCRVIVNFPPWEETREALAYQGTPYSLPPPHTLYSYSYFHLWRCFSLGSQATLFMMITESGGWAKFFCRGGGAVRFHCKCDRWYNIPL